MGGKKKIGLKQMERMQDKKDAEDAEKDKKKKEKEKGGAPREKKPVGIIPPDARSEKVVAELKKMHVLTPYAVSSRFNVRMSAAKELLKQLEEKGTIQLVSGSHNIKIYKVD